VPLYNSFQDVYLMVEKLKEILNKTKNIKWTWNSDKVGTIKIQK
jgi:hypothetical protein